MNPRREAGRRLVISGRNRPELLDFGEEILDPVSFPVGVSVKGALMRAVRLRRNHRLNAAFCERVQQGVRVKSLVADQCREVDRVQKRRYRHEIVTLAR